MNAFVELQLNPWLLSHHIVRQHQIQFWLSSDKFYVLEHVGWVRRAGKIPPERLGG